MENPRPACGAVTIRLPHPLDRGSLVATITGIGDHPCQRSARLLDDGWHNRLQCMAVIGIARRGGDMGDKLPALATIQRCGDGDLHAELIRPMRLAFADAFHLGRVPAVDLVAALALALFRITEDKVE